jgi:hypothetical protein
VYSKIKKKKIGILPTTMNTPEGMLIMMKRVVD